MNDTISRAAAVALVEEVESKRLKGEIDLTYAPMIKGIKALPSAQPGWIPCSERCPEQSGWYLVSLKNGNVQKAWYRVAPINQGGSYWRSPIKRPLAWMPLPKPYREGGQDGKN